MTSIKKIFSKNIVRLFLTVYLILGALFIIMLYLQSENEIYKIDNFDGNWNFSINGKENERINIDTYNTEDLHKGDKILLSKKLKEKEDILYPVILVDSNNCKVDLYVDNKKIGSNYTKNNDELVRNKLYLKLEKGYDDKILKLKINVLEDSPLSLIEDVYIISENSYFFNQLRSNTLKHLMGTFMIILGVILTSVLLVLPNKNNDTKRLFWIGITFVSAGLAIYSEFDLLDLYTKNSIVIENIKYIGLFVCALSILMMERCSYKKNKERKNMNVYIGVVAFACMLSMVLNFMKISSYENTMRWIGVIYILVIIRILVYNKNNYINASKIERSYLIGFSICYAECIFILSISQLADKRYWKNYGKYYLVLLVITFFINVLAYYSYVVEHYMDKITEKNILARFAYTDHLTGLSNRTKYEEIIEEIKTNKTQNVTIISFDLNNLKKVNDNIGHDAGDAYIKGFAKCIKKVLVGCDYIGRIGGDEFSVIYVTKINEISKLMSKLESSFESEMKDKNWEYKASFAYGYASNKEDKINDIDELIKLADDRMYTYKANQKGIQR